MCASNLQSQYFRKSASIDFVKELLMKVKTFYNQNDKVSNPTEKWGKRWKVSQSLNLIKKIRIQQKVSTLFSALFVDEEMWRRLDISHPFLYISSFTKWVGREVDVKI